MNDFVIGQGIQDARMGVDQVNLPPFHIVPIGFTPTLKQQFDILPESLTWKGVPDPLIFTATFPMFPPFSSPKITLIHCILTDQSFTITRTQDPNTKEITANFIYSARLISVNSRSVDFNGGNIGPPYVPPADIRPSFNFVLFNANGGPIFRETIQFSVPCNYNNTLYLIHQFPPGLYDLVAGAAWASDGWRVARC